jgi:hypothetical protein
VGVHANWVACDRWWVACLSRRCLVASWRGALRSDAGGFTCRRTSATIQPLSWAQINGTPGAVPRRIRGGRQASSVNEISRSCGHRRLIVEHDTRRRLHRTMTRTTPIAGLPQ